MNDREIKILGSGIAGLGAACKAQKQGIKYVIYEEKQEAGGLLNNFTVHGFRFDNAVHFSFTDIPKVRHLFDKTPHIKHEPNAYCLDRGYWLKHPVQNNLFSLPTEEKVRLIKGFCSRPELKPKNYSEWLLHQYGEDISNAYPEIYTQKYWSIDARQLSTTWIANRMRRAEIDEILRGAFEKRDDNHYYANEMRYPEKGGYFEFIRDIVNQCVIKFNKKIVKIDVFEKFIYFQDGTSESYEKIVSSLPLPMIIKLIPGVPMKVKQAAENLLWTTVDLVSVGFNKPNIPPYLWYYIYDKENLAARAYSPSLKSSDNAPNGKSSLQFEIYNLSINSKLEPNVLIENIKSRLISDQICNEENILFFHHKHLPYGNVIFNIGMEERRKIVLDYLTEVEIVSCGRFGAWEYYWSDQSFMSGYNSL